MSFSQYLPLLSQIMGAQLAQNTGGGWNSGTSPYALSGSAQSNGAGLSGLASLFGGGQAGAGDSGLTNQVSNQASGPPQALQMLAHKQDYSSALGDSPTGLFSGLNPGGGMSQTSSGALGGGISGQAAGDSALGSSSMDSGSGMIDALPGLLSMAGKMTGSGQSQTPMMAGHAHTGNASISQLMAAYGVPNGLLSTSVL
jgi:hypothetical protein